MRGLQQVFPLVLVGGIEQELRVDNPEVLAILVDSTLAQEQNLLPLGQGPDGYGPLLQGYLAAVWQHAFSPIFLCPRRTRKTT